MEEKAPRFRGLIIASIMLATLLYSIDWTIVVVAFPHMKGIFAATEDQVAWVITCYIVASAITMPTAGWASRRFGRKRIILFSIGGFTASSVMCGAADSLMVEVIARTIQGLTGAFIIPLSNSVMLDMFPRKEHGRALSIWSVGAFSGSFLGPVLGGYLTEYLSWRYVFYINIPIGIIAFTGIFVFMNESKKEKEAKLDWFGFLSLALGVSALQIMADRGHRLDWFESPEIVIEAALATLGFYLFFAHSLSSRSPFLDFRILAKKQFRLGMVLMGFYGLLTVPILAIMPVFLEELIGYPIDTVGLLQTPRGVGLVLALFLAGKLSTKVNPRVLMGIGLIAIAVSNYEMSRWSLDVGEWDIIWTGLLQGVGAGILIIPIQEVAFYGSSSSQRVDASAIINLTRSICSSVGVSITLVFYFMNSGTARSDLVPYVNRFSDYVSEAIVFGEHNQLLAQLGREIDRQASMLGYSAAFLFLSALPLIPFLLLCLSGRLRVGDQS